MDKAEQRRELERYGQFFDRSYRVGPEQRQNFEFIATLPTDLAAGITPGEVFTLSGPVRESETQPDIIVGHADKIEMMVMAIQHLPDGHKELHLLPHSPTWTLSK